MCIRDRKTSRRGAHRERDRLIEVRTRRGTIHIGTTTTALMGISSFIAWQVWEMKMLLTRTTMRLDSHEQRISVLEQRP